MNDTIALVADTASGLVPTPNDDGMGRRLADFATFTEAVDYAASGAKGLNFHDPRGSLVRVYPFSEMRLDAIKVAQRLIARGFATGDRVALIAPFGLGGWSPATRIVAAGVEGDPGLVGERWTALSPIERKAQARARVERWRAGGGEPRLRVALPPGPGSDLLLARLRSDLAEIGVRLERAPSDASADLRLIDLVARYPRAEWFLNQLSCQARRAPCSPGADERMAAARSSHDPAERRALLAEAEDELTRANVFIPFGQPIRWSLVRGHVTGFATNPWNIHPLMPMAVRPR